jgi:Uncharacterised nucleotidyltransferase
MAEQTFEAIEAALKKAVSALREAQVEFLLAGSLASWARGGPETRHDLDFIVKPEQAELALEALAQKGMRPERPAEEWLYKAWDGDLLIDVIFHPRGLPVTDEVMERGEELHVLGMTVPVMAIEDVLATKLLALSEHRVDYSDLLEMARALREQIDWRTLRSRTRGSPYAAAFFVLVEELGVVPEEHAARGAEVRVIAPPAGPP